MQNKHFSFEELEVIKTLFSGFINEIAIKNEGSMSEDMQLALIITFVRDSVDMYATKVMVSEAELLEIKGYLTMALFECIAKA